MSSIVRLPPPTILMSEEKLSIQLTGFLRQALRDYRVGERQSLLYKIFIDQDGEITPEIKKIKNPKRAQGAFQTDILIARKRNNIPLVALELKYKGLSTHDIITYSSKAVRHKEIYPYLRYGLVAARRKLIDRKFFTHNIGIDFALVYRGETSNGQLLKMVRKQIRVAEQMRRILGANGVALYETSVSASS